jgi:hypothetical protein
MESPIKALMSPQKKVGIILIIGLAFFSAFYYATWGSYHTGFEDGRKNVTCQINPATKTIRIGDCVCPMPNICPPEKTCPECQTCPTTTNLGETTTTTLSCPSLAVPPETEKTLLNLPKNIISAKPPAVQHGCYVCMAATWEELQLPHRPKFYAGPSLGNAQDYYEPLKGNNITADAYVFPKDYGYNHGMSGEGYFLNITSWKWNNTPQCWDEFNKTASNENHTRIDTLCNESNNLWIQRR